jgi:ABC-type polysaccharide/polyol phosphate export permease
MQNYAAECKIVQQNAKIVQQISVSLFDLILALIESEFGLHSFIEFVELFVSYTMKKEST